MSVDYVQIHTIDLASLERRYRDDASLGRVMRQVIADLSDDNGDSEYEFVRNALASAKTGRETRRRQTEAARAAKASSSEGAKVQQEPAMPSSADKVVQEDNVEQYDAISDADTPEASVRKEEEGEKSSVLCTSGAPASVSKSSARLEFEAFRKAYPGTRRGADVEWKAFCAKASPEDVALLMPALLREKAHKEECARVGAFCPPWANLATWINQRRWTQEFETPCAPQARKTSEDLENDKKARMLRWLKDREAGIPTGDNYDEIPEVENTEDGNA